MQRSVKSLLYVLLIMKSTAHQCDKATVNDCAKFTQYLANLGRISQHQTALNNCHVLVIDPAMTFYEASVACTNAGGHLSRLYSKEQIPELYEHTVTHGIRLSASSLAEGVWVTTCWPSVPKSRFRWAKGNEPNSLMIHAGAALSLCTEDGHIRLCYVLDEDQTKLSFFCGLDAHQSESEEDISRKDLSTDIHETVNDLRVSVITVMSVFMGVVVISMFIIFGLAYFKPSTSKARTQTLETAQGSEQRYALPMGPPALPMGPPAAWVHPQFGAERGQPAAEVGQAGAKDVPSETSRSPM